MYLKSILLLSLMVYNLNVCECLKEWLFQQVSDLNAAEYFAKNITYFNYL